MVWWQTLLAFLVILLLAFLIFLVVFYIPYNVLEGDYKKEWEKLNNYFKKGKC